MKSAKERIERLCAALREAQKIISSFERKGDIRILSATANTIDDIPEIHFYKCLSKMFPDCYIDPNPYYDDENVHEASVFVDGVKFFELVHDEEAGNAKLAV